MHPTIGYYVAKDRPAGPAAQGSNALAPGTSADLLTSMATAQQGSMDRQTWLDQRHRAVLASYDQDAATYDDRGYPATAQRTWVARLLDACPPAAKILDAPCGTGQYFSMVAAEIGRASCRERV